MKNAKKYQAVLFDFDGVLAQTMQDNFLAWKAALATAQIVLPEKDYYLLEGCKAVEVARHFLDQNKKDLSLISDLVRIKEDYYAKNNHFSLYPGATELLTELKAKGFKLALITGAGRERLERTLKPEISQFFSVIICADDVSKGKPDPEPYLTAAKKIQVAPTVCLVIENAPLGIRSARTAGMDCVAITTTLSADFLEEAQIILPNLERVAAIAGECR